MSETPNGWDTWYSYWDQAQANYEIVPYHELARWGQVFQERVTLNDHWIDYLHPGPMSLEDGMSIAYVLYDAGVDVEALVQVLESFQPIDAPMTLGIPLCWLVEPIDHIQELLEMVAEAPQFDPELFDQLQESIEAVGGEPPPSPEEMPDLVRAMIISATSWLLEMNKLLGDNGNQALRAWWQGRLIILLRESLTPKRKRGRRRRRPAQPIMPSAFQDLIQQLDIGELDDSTPDSGKSGN